MCKKILVLALTVCLCLSMSVGTFASGEATSELASTISVPGVNVRDTFTIDVELSFADQGNGVKTYAIDFEGHHIEGTVHLGQWTADSENSAEQDISEAVQAAYEAMTGASRK